MLQENVHIRRRLGGYVARWRSIRPPPSKTGNDFLRFGDPAQRRKKNLFMPPFLKLRKVSREESRLSEGREDQSHRKKRRTISGRFTPHSGREERYAVT